MTNLRSSAAAWTCALACFSAQAAEPPQVIDSKVWASGVVRVAPAWIDSRRVLFLTGPDFKFDERLRSLAIWDVNGNARIHRANVNEYCYRDGVVVYKVLDTGDNRLIRGTWFEGKLGEEKEVRRDTEGDSARIHDPINCSIATPAELAGMAKQTNRQTVPLLEGHGYLDVGPYRGADSTKNAPIRYFKPGSNQGIALPFGRFEVLFPTTYYPFAKAYVFRNLSYGKQPATDTSGAFRRDPRVGWVLNADGKAAERVISEGPWTGGPSLAPYLSAAGLVFVNPSSASRADGIYLSIDGQPRKLLAGLVSHVGVSGDGCMLAFSSAPRPDQDRADANNRRTLKAINLCRS